MTVEPEDLDFPTLAQIAATLLSGEVLRRLTDAGFGDLRTSHGYVFQRLMGEPVTVGDIADALGFTPQAASLVVVELERLGCVSRHVDPDDRRVRRVSLTDRGRAAIEAARRIRAELAEEVTKRAGERSVRAARKALVVAIELAGGVEQVRGRRVRPPA